MAVDVPWPKQTQLLESIVWLGIERGGDNHEENNAHFAQAVAPRKRRGIAFPAVRFGAMDDKNRATETQGS